jgi:GNAT superfamily N-acetyltransferase
MVGKKHAYVEAFMQKSSHVVRLDALEVVDPALRGKGLAEYLAYRVYVLCKKFGCTKIVGSAESFGDHAIPHGALLGFYAKLGARVVGKTFAGCNTKIEFTLPSSGLIASKL